MTGDPSGTHLCGKPTKRGKGPPCTKRKVAGADVCLTHGASAPQVRRKAVVRAELKAWGVTDETLDPGEVLLRLVAQSARRCELYGMLLQQAYEAAERETADRDTGDGDDSEPPGDDEGGDSETETLGFPLPGGIRALIGHKYGITRTGETVPVEEAIRGLVLLEGIERDRCASFAAKAIQAGLAERAVRLEEQKAAMIVAAMRDALSRLGLDPGSPQVVEAVTGALAALG